MQDSRSSSSSICKTEARAFSPASVGNVAVGFDVLGHVLTGPGDTATVRTIAEPRVRIAAIRGAEQPLPLEAERNTAGVALMALREALDLPYGFEVEIDKGIALGSGMGGSAASAVAALVAANALLPSPLAVEALYPFAMDGEAVASGGRHGDNVGPMLVGGLALCTKDRLVRVPLACAPFCLLVHPHAVLETRRAREALRGNYTLGELVGQSANLASFLLGCQLGDFSLLRAGLRDEVVEPRRAPLVRGFAEAKAAALQAGALGASLSGAGPSVFAWFESEAEAQAAAPAVQQAFRSVGVESDAWVSPIEAPAAKVLP